MFRFRFLYIIVTMEQRNCCGLDTTAVGLFIGYFSFIFRGLILLYMLLALKDYSDQFIKTDKYYDEFLIYISIVGAYVIGTVVSVALIHGVQKRKSKYILPYYIFELILTFSMSMLAIYPIIARNFVNGKKYIFT